MKRQTVSLCVIARNEEATIGMAIKSVLALVDEVIVVDTGIHGQYPDHRRRVWRQGHGCGLVR